MWVELGGSNGADVFMAVDAVDRQLHVGKCGTVEVLLFGHFAKLFGKPKELGAVLSVLRRFQYLPAGRLGQYGQGLRIFRNQVIIF